MEWENERKEEMRARCLMLCLSDIFDFVAGENEIGGSGFGWDFMNSNVEGLYKGTHVSCKISVLSTWFLCWFKRYI